MADDRDDELSPQPEVTYDRAGGGTVCETCGKLYYDHPYDMGVLGYDDRPFLKIICGGRRVKL